MKSFLLKQGKPQIRWGLLPDGVFFEGALPEGYDLALCPSDNYVILDVDVKNGKDGFASIPMLVLQELDETFNYFTRSGGRHYFIEYTGDKTLINRATEYGLDLRVGRRGDNAGGYVKYVHTEDIRDCISRIQKSSPNLNAFLEKLFSYV